MDILSTLQALNACHGPAGDESQVASVIRTFAQPYSDDCHVDSLGNLIVRKRGNGPRILFAAHMDSIGFILTHIDEKGFLRFGKLGGLPAHSAWGAPVRFKNGAKGVVCLDNKINPKDMTLEDLYIDLGARDAAEAKSMVRVGDTAVYDTRAFVSGDRLVSPYMDNRISCVALLLAMERISCSQNDLYFVFTVQEELGYRGAKTAAFGIDPEYSLAVDVTLSDDELNPKHFGSCLAGDGAAIKVMDSSVICHPNMVKHLVTLAKERHIPYQRDVICSRGTDAGAIHLNGAGVRTGGVSIPCRYIHSPLEMVDFRDVEACAALVAAFAEHKCGEWG